MLQDMTTSNLRFTGEIQQKSKVTCQSNISSVMMQTKLNLMVSNAYFDSGKELVSNCLLKELILLLFKAITINT